VCEVALVLDEWMAAGFTESSEVRKFYSAYAQKMGVDSANPQDAAERAKALFGQYKGIWAEVASKMQNVKGYPVRSSFTLALGGAQCKDSNAQQGQGDQATNGQSNPTPSNPADIAGALAGTLGGFFHKKQDDAPPPAAQPQVTPVAIPPGDVALMTVSSQLTSVSMAAVGADAFAVPANFRKIDVRAQ
jgi:hypothetical protein